MIKILTIDDKKDNLITMSALLKNLIPGCTVITAQSGAEGIKKAKAELPDTILLDIKMPEMDGFEVCKRLKSDENTKGIPVIMITAVKTDTESCIKGLETGADSFIAKPIDGTELVAQVNVALRIKKAEDLLRRERDLLEETVQERTKELRKSEAKYRELVQNANSIILRRDVKGNITFFNEFAQKFLGYTEDEIIGKNVVGTIVSETDSAGRNLAEMIKDISLRPERYVTNENENICRNGERVRIAWTNKAIRDRDGNVVEILCVGNDITDRVRAEEENRKLEAQLQQAWKMEAIGTLAGGIAHDFNNLLMGIQGRASLMLMGMDSSHPRFEHLRQIEEIVKSGADLTRQLLGFARGGKYEVKPADLNEIIGKSSDMFWRTKKEIKIHGKYQKDIWTVEVDQGQIEQVLLNFYINAWQAMPGGGELYVQTENVTLDGNYVKPYNLEPGKYVRISVTDTGVGMDKATQERVFDPFFTTREMSRGTGLGLASAYGIIKNHGGIINVYSEKGTGSTFNIYLPASEKEIIKEEILPEEVFSGTETVLFVDDEEMIVDVGTEMLKMLGYDVVIAHSGKESIEIYEKNRDRIAIVILDMIMPGISGGETYDRLKEINPDIKVLLSSGYSISGQATEILERGCDGFMQKPFNVKLLSQKIREILDTK